MKLSIVTCTFNSEPYLSESINSVLEQTYSDIEYIFVDGGSTDGTIERIEKIARPVTVINNVRGGISRAMNQGIRVATGDVVAHLHSDDYYLHCDVLSLIAEAMADPKIGWCYGRIKRLVNGRLNPEAFVAPKYSRRRLARRNFIPHPATFIRRDWINRVGMFDETLKYAMDYDLWLRLARVGPPQQLDMPLAVFREHGGSLSSNNRLAAMDEDYQVRLSHSDRNPIDLWEHRIRYWWRRLGSLQRTG